MAMSLDSNKNDEVRSAVINIAADVFEISPDELRDEQHLEDDLGTTSVMRLDFLVSLERRFGIQFDADGAEKAMRIGEVVTLVKQYVDQKGAA